MYTPLHYLMYIRLQNIMTSCVEYLAVPPSIITQGILKMDIPDMQTVCLPIYDTNIIMLCDATKSSLCKRIDAFSAQMHIHPMSSRSEGFRYDED